MVIQEKDKHIIQLCKKYSKTKQHAKTCATNDHAPLTVYVCKVTTKLKECYDCYNKIPIGP